MTQAVFTRTDKPLLNVVFTLVMNSAEYMENVTVRSIKYYTYKSDIEPVANDAMIEVAALHSMGRRYDL